MARQTSRRRPTRQRRATRPPVPPAVWQAAADLVRQRTLCLICHARGRRVVGTREAVLLLRDPVAWGFPRGMRTARVYVLCEACAARPDHPERAEEIVWAERQRVMQGRWN